MSKTYESGIVIDLPDGSGCTLWTGDTYVFDSDTPEKSVADYITKDVCDKYDFDTMPAYRRVDDDDSDKPF